MDMNLYEYVDEDLVTFIERPLQLYSGRKRGSWLSSRCIGDTFNFISDTLNFQWIFTLIIRPHASTSSSSNLIK